MEKQCLNCGNTIQKLPSHSKKYWEKIKYCGAKCYGESKLGKTATEATKLLMSEAQKLIGNRPPPRYGERSEQERQNMSKGMHGISRSEEFKEFCRQRQLNLPPATIAFRRKISDIQKEFVKEGKHSFGHGVKTAESAKIRNSLDYKLWRESVFQRDNYACCQCGDRSRAGHHVYLEADHIKPFALHPELRFDVTNGRTLCKPCHKKTPTYGYNTSKKVKQLQAA